MSYQVISARGDDVCPEVSMEQIAPTAFGGYIGAVCPQCRKQCRQCDEFFPDDEDFDFYDRCSECSEDGDDDDEYY